jgi:hypothetical protein
MAGVMKDCSIAFQIWQNKKDCFFDRDCSLKTKLVVAADVAFHSKSRNLLLVASFILVKNAKRQQGRDQQGEPQNKQGIKPAKVKTYRGHFAFFTKSI